MKIISDIWAALDRAIRAINAFAELFENATEQGRVALQGQKPGPIQIEADGDAEPLQLEEAAKATRGRKAK